MSFAQLETLRQAASELMAKYPVQLAYLHGSQATGLATRLSDIDVAILADPELTARERLRLELTLENELSKRCPGDFDVRSLNRAPLEARARVVQTGRLLYARDDRLRVAFEADVRDRYFDFLPVIRLHRDAYLRACHAAAKERDQP